MWQKSPCYNCNINNIFNFWPERFGKFKKHRSEFDEFAEFSESFCGTILPPPLQTWPDPCIESRLQAVIIPLWGFIQLDGGFVLRKSSKNPPLPSNLRWMPNAVNVTKTDVSQQHQQHQQHFRPLDSENAEIDLPNLQNLPNQHRICKNKFNHY